MTGRIALLSLAAIRMAAAGSPAEPAVVARWLYRFGTVRRGSAIDRDFGPEDDPMAVLGITKGGRARRLIETAYEASSLRGWYSFARITAPSRAPVVCKLYVSPRPEALSDAFPIIAGQLVRSEVRSFKVGRGIEGLLRPDKIIAYFEDRAHLEEVAKALEQSLHGCPAQGVPFTAEMGGHGLISAGVDPPAGDAAASWRAWVTQRLAASLTTPCADAGMARILLPLDSPDIQAPVPSLAAGQEFAGLEIEALVRSLEDTEVYQARQPSGGAAALKIARDDRPAVAGALAHEARMLDRLGGADSPKLLGHGAERERAFVVMEWCDGVSIAVAAQQARAARDRCRLHRIVTKLLEAYGRLHASGVLHGDIHPGNCLVCDDGRVVILDFGNARLIEVGRHEADPARTGIPHFYDPMMAGALLAGKIPPTATPASEQFALSVLAYLLLTGLHPIETPAVQEELLRNIVDRPPLPFTARGVTAWPAVEAVIGRGLAKQPGERFPEVADLARAFASAGRQPAQPRRCGMSSKPGSAPHSSGATRRTGRKNPWPKASGGDKNTSSASARPREVKTLVRALEGEGRSCRRGRLQAIARRPPAPAGMEQRAAHRRSAQGAKPHALCRRSPPRTSARKQRPAPEDRARTRVGTHRIGDQPRLGTPRPGPPLPPACGL